MTATIGPPVPAVAALGRELRLSLPPALVEALDKIGDQIQIEILEPLLCAASTEEMAGIFERVFPTFRDYYISTVLILWGFLHEDAQRFSALTIRGFQESEQMIRSRGPHWIGQDASLNALNGLATVIRVAKGATRLVDPTRSAELHANESGAEPWANSIIAYAMAFSSVLAALSSLESGRTTPLRLENVASLAHWSRTYAAQAYHFTKTLGLLKTSRPGAPIRGSDEEDSALAGAGLDSYVEALGQDDQP
jgi:hypothetical protein